MKGGYCSTKCTVAAVYDRRFFLVRREVSAIIDRRYSSFT